MKKIVIGIFLIFIVIFSASIYGIGPNDAISHYDDGEFSFDYPSNMTVNHNPMILYLNNLGSFPDKSTSNLPFKDKYTVQMFFISNYYPRITFTVYKTSSEPNIGLNDVISYEKSTGSGYITYQGNVKLNGISAYEIDSRIVPSGRSSYNEHTIKKVLFEKKGMIYILYFDLDDPIITHEDETLFNDYTNKILQNFSCI